MSKYDKAGLAMIPSGYKASKVYSLIPNSSDGDFDFTRASTATRINKDGLIDTVASGVPRLEYPLIDGVVQDTPSLLLEPSRTNLVPYSQEFTGWSLTNAVETPNALISPDGNLNASKFVTSSVGVDIKYSSINVTANTTYTYSFYCNYVSGEGLQGRFYDNTNGANIEYYSYMDQLEEGKWKRVVRTFTTPVGCTNIQVWYLATSDNFPVIAYYWGAQLEEGSYPTSYIPTSGTIVTRAAETCNGAGTSAEFNDSEGVLFAEISALYDTQINRFLGINDGSNANRVIIGYTSVSSNTPRGILTSGGVAQSAIDFSANDITDNIKIAIKYKTDAVALWINGFKVGTDITATMPTGLNNFSFDSNGAGGSNFYGKTKQVISFKEELSDSELEDLTSWDSFNEMATAQEYIIK